MVTVVPQNARHLDRHFGRNLGFFKNFIFSKIAGNVSLKLKVLFVEYFSYVCG